MSGRKKKVIDEDALTERLTKLKALIGAKWYLTIEELCNRVHISKDTSKRALNGYYIGEETSRKIIEYLEDYDGE